MTTREQLHALVCWSLEDWGKSWAQVFGEKIKPERGPEEGALAYLRRIGAHCRNRTVELLANRIDGRW